MNALAGFQAGLPTWRPTVEAWLDTLPVAVRTDAARAALAYLFAAPAMRAIGVEQLAHLDAGTVDWLTLEQRAADAGNIERALLHAARCLANDDPGPALGLMLVFPEIDAFVWAHAAATVHTLISERLQRHALSPR